MMRDWPRRPRSSDTGTWRPAFLAVIRTPASIIATRNIIEAPAERLASANRLGRHGLCLMRVGYASPSGVPVCCIAFIVPPLC